MFPILRLWMNARRVAAGRQATAKCRPRARSRPHLEPLEDRLAPATHVWQGAFSSLWSDARNWSEGGSPAGDSDATVIFPAGDGVRLTSTNDLPGTTTVWAIGVWAPGYTLNGNPVAITRAISDASSSGSNRINFLGITFRGAVARQEFVVFDGARLVINSPIAGGGMALPLFKQGGGKLVLGGSPFGYNTFTPGLALNEGTVVAAGDDALGTGTLFLSGGTLESSASDVTLANPFTVTRSSVVKSIGGFPLKLTGDGQIRQGQLLSVVADDGVGGSGYVGFSGVLSGLGGLLKGGPGGALLDRVNTYEGGTALQEGTLGISKANALGQGLLALRGGTLRALFFRAPIVATLPNPFTVSGGNIEAVAVGFGIGATLVFSGPGTIDQGATLAVFVDQATVSFSGPLGGSGGLTVTAEGTVGSEVVLSGTAANTYTGTTTVNGGKLVLQKPAGVTAVPGPLVIGDGVGGLGADVVSLAAANQIADTAPVTIKSSGLLKLNNFSEKYGPLTGTGKVIGGDPPTLTVAFDDVTATFAGAISDPLILVKEGTGTWVLSGANTYEGETIVASGTLLVDGSLSGPVTVSAGATLGGSGTTGPVTLAPGAAVSPGGAAPGVQRTQDFAFADGSSFVVRLNGPDPGTGYDQLHVLVGTLSLNDATLDASLGFRPDPGQRFVIINNDGGAPVSGTFAGLPQGAALLIGGVPFHIYYDGDDGNDVVLVRNVPPAVAVPGDRTAFQNVDLALGGTRVGDPEDDTLTVTLQVGHGTLTLGTVAGVDIGGNGTAQVTLSGGQAALNAALAGLLYRPGHNFSGADALSVTASDGLETSTATVAIRVKSLAEQAADLQAQVNALRDAGALNPGQANALVVKLRLQNNDGDAGRVQAFLSEVDALLRGGILSQAQADALSGPGNVLLLGLRRR